VNVGGVVTITSVVGGGASVAGGCVIAGAVETGVVTRSRTDAVVEAPTLVDVDDVAVAGFDPPLWPLVASSTITATTRAPPSRTDEARAQRGHPRNAHEPGGTTGARGGTAPGSTPAGGGPGAAGGGPGASGGIPIGPGSTAVGSSTGIGTVGSSSSSVMLRRCLQSYPPWVSRYARPRRFVGI
jgi:hypothetical protein